MGSDITHELEFARQEREFYRIANACKQHYGVKIEELPVSDLTLLTNILQGELLRRAEITAKGAAGDNYPTWDDKELFRRDAHGKLIENIKNRLKLTREAAYKVFKRWEGEKKFSS